MGVSPRRILRKRNCRWTRD